jgi:hypothetical protein
MDGSGRRDDETDMQQRERTAQRQPGNETYRQTLNTTMTDTMCRSDGFKPNLHRASY